MDYNDVLLAPTQRYDSHSLDGFVTMVGAVHTPSGKVAVDRVRPFEPEWQARRRALASLAELVDNG